MNIDYKASFDIFSLINYLILPLIEVVLNESHKKDGTNGNLIKPSNLDMEY